LIEIIEHANGVTFSIRVHPRASRDEIGGEWLGALKVRLTAPPVDSRANDALCRLLAAQLNVPPAAVRILSGERSRTKRIDVRGIIATQVQALGAVKSKRQTSGKVAIQ
jgi:hypothetical protein